MKNKFSLFSLFLLLWIHPSLNVDAHTDSSLVKVGDVAPDFSCRTLSGDEFVLSEQNGKVVLINFFATWCGPCLAKLPHLESDIYQKYKENNHFRLISIGREHDAAELKPFKKQKKLSFAMAPDPTREIYAQYAEKFIPRVFLVGKDGKILFSSIGFDEDQFAQLKQLISEALN